MNHPYILTRAAEADLQEIVRYTLREWGQKQSRIKGTSNYSECVRLGTQIRAIKAKTARNSQLLRKFATQRERI